MEESEREQLRRLALWLSRRRDLDLAVAGLTRYGPAASGRVAAHLDELRRLMDEEADAFAAVEAGAERVPQLPLPAAEPAPGTLHSLQAERRRRDRRS